MSTTKLQIKNVTTRLGRCSAVILAGGFGTRLSDAFPGIPKPMVPIDGVPILERIIKECADYGYLDIVVVLHHMPEKIMEYFGDGSRLGVSLTYFMEPVPLGTGGALFQVLDYLTDTFLVLYADVFTTVNLSNLLNFHKSNRADISIVVHPNDHPYDSDLVCVDDSSRVFAFDSAPHGDSYLFGNLVNAALYAVSKNSLRSLKRPSDAFDIARDLFPRALSSGLAIFAYNTQEYIKDMGTPDRRTRVESDVSSGVARSRSLDTPRQAIFFDRDGTINVELGYITRPEQIELLTGASEGIRRVNQSQYLAVCITNQPVVARGDCSLAQLRLIHNHLEMQLGVDRAYLDAIYFCPHHPDKGFAGEVTSLKVSCDCRKPEPGLLLNAAKEMNIDLTKSWMVGDRSVDILAAKRGGVMAALVETGASGLDGRSEARPQFVGKDLNEITKFLVDDYPRYQEIIESLLNQLNGINFIYICGASRSGKTTFSALLQWALTSRGKIAHVVELDQFLLSERSEDRPYTERYDHERIAAFCERLSSSGEFPLEDLGMSHASGQLLSYGVSMATAEDIFIFEGTIAFETAAKSVDGRSFRIFIEGDFSERRSRFNRKYERRGLTGKQIDELWTSRLVSEDKEITLLSDQADVILKLGA